MIAGQSSAPMNPSSPRRREKQPARTPLLPTPNTSPRRNTDQGAATRDASLWTRTRAVPPAALNIAATQYGHMGVRGGHQFTVGNVSNGMLYLRPVMRSNQELRQNFILPPSTPPSSAEDTLPIRRISSPRRSSGNPQTSPPQTPTFSPLSDRSNENRSYVKASPPVTQRRHQRSRSYTVATDRFPAIHEHGVTKVQIQIDQVDGPAVGEDESRTRTAAEDNFDALDVQIPRYNLGSPGFSPGGTPFMLYASSTALPSTTGEYGSTPEQTTPLPGGRPWLWPRTISDSKSTGTSGISREITASIMSTIATGQPASVHQMVPSPLALSPRDFTTSLSSIPLIPSPPVPLQFDPLTINPRIFDDISSPPGSDHPSVVMYHPHTNAIHAATPARIIAEITSATFVDYHLLSDFFLTFRLFMNSTELASHLMSRFHWALERDDDAGKIVRVRTFVAIRHWILNYFADDFVPHVQFREEFAKALNDMVSAVGDGYRTGDLKIIGELKKCWRRTCALYWEPDTVLVDPKPEDPITPGGDPGKRSKDDASLKRLSRLSPPPQLDSFRTEKTFSSDSFLNDVVAGQQGSKYRATSSVHEPSALNSNSRSGAAKSEPSLLGRTASDPKKPYSSHSASSASASKHTLPGAHKRSGSFSDALRDDRQPLPLQPPAVKPTHMYIPPPYSGSLVRGNQFPPTGPSVGMIVPSTPEKEVSQFTSSSSEATSADGVKQSTNGPGIRKIIGTVKKAFGAQNVGKKSAKSVAPNNESTGNGRAKAGTGNGIGAAAINPGLATAMLGDDRSERFDLLGAVAMESYQRAMAAIAKEAERIDESEESSTHEVFGRRGIYDGVGEGHEPATASSSVLVPTDLVPVQKVYVEGEDFLESPSTVSPQSERDEGFLAAGRSFLVDASEQSVSSRDSVEMGLRQDAPPLPLAVTKSPPLTPGPVRRDTPAEEPSTPPNETVPEDTPRQQISTALTTDNILIPERPHSFALSVVTYNDSDAASSIFTHEQADSATTGHFLRRRPGGNLRGANTIGELEPRPKSFASVGTSNYTIEDFGPTDLRIRPFQQRPFSPASRSTISDARTLDMGVASLTAIGRPGPTLLPAPNLGDELASSEDRTTIEDRSMHTEDGDSSKADFEAGVQLLRELPDDSSDEGGVDVALAKLEGTYRRKKSGASTPSAVEFRKSFAKTLSRKGAGSFLAEVEKETIPETPSMDGTNDEQDEHESHWKTRAKHRHKQVVDHVPLHTPPLMEGSALPTPAVGEDTPDAVPILERGLRIDTGNGGALRKSGLSAVMSVPESNRSSTRETAEYAEGLSPRPGPSDPSRTSEPYDVDLTRLDSELERLAQHRRTNSGSTKSASNHPRRNLSNRRHQSSNPSSEMSFEMVSNNANDSSGSLHTTNSNTLPPVDSGTVNSELGMWGPPLRPPPSPPLTFEQALSMSPSSGVRTGTRDDARSPISPLTPQSAGLSRRQTVQPQREKGDAAESSKIASAGSTYQSVSGGNPTKGSSTNTATNARTTSNVGTGADILEPTTVHLPFILAYDSELLAKQFTLIEKDALLETDWKELVELSWGPINDDVRDWVQILHHKAIKGVEMSIMRFNLVCRWARSEIVLTRSLNERARTISKFIHIAAHARNMFNYATMYQLTIALLTTDIARLRKTWELVGESEIRTLRELERLVQPTGNFRGLRDEMERALVECGRTKRMPGRAAAGADHDGIGCIPFVGLFTHDLILNAQRPLTITVDQPTPTQPPPPQNQSGRHNFPIGTAISSPPRRPPPPPPSHHPPPPPPSSFFSADPSSSAVSLNGNATLINFDRHRATAGIVKKLLRMVEASQKYNRFEAVDGVCERCLWISALSDDEIKRLSWGIEPPS